MACSVIAGHLALSDAKMPVCGTSTGFHFHMRHTHNAPECSFRDRSTGSHPSRQQMGQSACWVFRRCGAIVRRRRSILCCPLSALSSWTVFCILKTRQIPPYTVRISFRYINEYMDASGFGWPSMRQKLCSPSFVFCPSNTQEKYALHIKGHTCMRQQHCVTCCYVAVQDRRCCTCSVRQLTMARSLCTSFAQNLEAAT